MGTMAEEIPLTPAERIALVDSDETRKNGQIGIALGLIVFAMAFLSIYAFFKADAAFLTYMATGVLSLVFAGIGAAFAIFGLGRTVGSTNTANNDQILIMLEAIKDLQKKYFFYVWDFQSGLVRWMTSFCTRPEEVDKFLADLQDII